MNRLFQTAGLIVLLAFTCASLSAQTPTDWVPTGTDNWNVGANWVNDFVNEVPSSEFNEIAIISNGGTAQVTDTPVAAGGIQVGPGTVQILSGGALTAEVNDISGASGAASIASEGLVSIAAGGTFNVESLDSGGILQVAGPSANVNVNADLTLNDSSELVAQIDAAGFEPISVGGNATLGGRLQVEFSGGTPVPGDRWDLLDAAAIAGNFTAIETIGGGQLGPGQVFALRQQAGGANGNLAQIVLQQRLVLSVDRSTGDVSIQNPGTTPISIDGYRLQSAVGSLDPLGWSSFEDQQVPGGPWFETGTGGDSNQLAELNPTGTSDIAAASASALGSIFAPNFRELGEETEDLRFTYTMPGEITLEGAIEYQGDKQFNNLVLTVDPASGAATLQNESQLSVVFDGYRVLSESGSLLTGDAQFMSLEDQAAGDGDWREANLSPQQLAELQIDGVTTLNQNEGYQLGTIFSTSGTQDLILEFVREGEFAPFLGEVVYGPLPGNVRPPGTAGPTADFDGDGDVDDDDFSLWLGGFGCVAGCPIDSDGDDDTDGHDFLAWQAQTGTVAGAAAAAIPEPSSGLLVMFLCCVAAIHRRR